MKKRYLVPFTLDSEQGDKVYKAFKNLDICPLTAEIAMLAIRITDDPEDNSDIFADLTEYLYVAIEDHEKQRHGEPPFKNLDDWNEDMNELCEEVFDLIYNLGAEIQQRYISIAKRIMDDGFSLTTDYVCAEWLGDDTVVLSFVTDEEITKSANRLARGEF